MRFFQYIVLGLLLFLFFPVYLGSQGDGLDASGMYAVNLLNYNGCLWGRDIGFTFGPLGFLTYMVNMGKNAYYYLFFWGSVFLLHAAVLYYMITKFFCYQSIYKWKQIILFVCLNYLAILYLNFNVVADYYITYLVMLLLSLCWYCPQYGKQIFPFACALTVVSLFVKFNSGIMNISSIALFLIIAKYGLHRKIKLFLLEGVTALLGFVVCYLCYNPNFYDLITYIHDAMELSFGYGSAMQLQITNAYDVVYLGFIIAAILYILVLLYKDRQINSMYYVGLFLGVFFMSFKHAVIRGDHIKIGIMGFLLFLSIMLFFLGHDLRERLYTKKYMVAVILLVVTGFSFNMFSYKNNIFQPIIGRVDSIKNIPDRISHINVTTVKLDNSYLKEIKGKTVTIYPWEISLIDIDADYLYKPLPIFQAYTAYTPYLDQRNAEFLANNNAPEYVILDLATIDDRYALWECPATFNALFEHYYVEKYNGKSFLLKHTDDIKVKDQIATTMTFSKDDVIDIPDSNNFTKIKVNMKLNLWGKILKFLYKAPEMYMQIELSNGQTIQKRIVVDNFYNNVLINAAIINDNDFIQLFNKKVSNTPVKKIRFISDGMWLYEDTVEVSFTDTYVDNKNTDISKSDRFALLEGCMK